MPAAEPHPRRRRAPWRVLAVAVASFGVLLAAPAAAQLLPTETTEPDDTEPEPDPVETTTTTEVDEAPTTTDGSTATSRAPTTTDGSSTGDRGADLDEDAFEDDLLDADPTVEDEVPTETTSTARDLLVSGDGSDGAESTTTTSTTLVEVAATEGSSLDEETQIWLIVAGLVVIALLIGVWTWRYWLRTKPVPPEADPDQTTVFRRS